MKFFFIPDYRHRYRFISSEPVRQIQVEFSRLKKLWEQAKEKFVELFPRVLRQEQAFQMINKLEEEKVLIYHGGILSERRVRTKFFFYLQKQKSKHTLLLIGETLLLPISGLMALLPGPNVFFGVLALMMITHWQALQGIRKLGKKEHQFQSAASLRTWCQALEERRESEYEALLTRMEKDFQLPNIKKILFK